jgi:hypothetical protein
MIPTFPNMKPLAIANKREVESFTAHFLPYSDFNFLSMWSWDTKGDMAFSQLNGNLIVRFTDYITSEPFYSFIGTTDANATAKALLEASAAEGLSSSLKLIPHETAVTLTASAFTVTAQPQHMDYVLSVQRLMTFEGRALRTKRSHARRFLEDHPSADIQILDLRNPAIRRDLQNLSELWSEGKGAGGTVSAEQESAALRRCLDSELRAHITAFGVFAKQSLIAFWALEEGGSGYGLCHFEKADTKSFPCVLPFLRQRTAPALYERGIRFINVEQDLGIEGLRQSKQSYWPDHYLQKYSVRYT